MFVQDIYADSQDRIWIATEGKGVSMLDKEHLVHYNTSNGLTSNIALCLMETDSGEMLVGTYDGGINVIKNNKVYPRYVSQTKITRSGRC